MNCVFIALILWDREETRASAAYVVDLDSDYTMFVTALDGLRPPPVREAKESSMNVKPNLVCLIFFKDQK